MFFPIIINWTSPFPNLGLLGSIFIFIQIKKRNVCKQTVENLIRRRYAAPDLVLLCLFMSHTKDAGLYLLTRMYLLGILIQIVSLFSNC